MTGREDLKGPYVLLVYAYTGGWQGESFPTLKAALEGDRRGAADWTVLKVVDWQPVETGQE